MNDRQVWAYNVEIVNNNNADRKYFQFATDCDDPRDGFARILRFEELQNFFKQGYTLCNFSGPSWQGMRYLPGKP